MRLRVLCATVMLSALAVPWTALGEEPAKPDYAAAKRHFKAGQEMLQMDRYAEAVVEFKKAYDITQDGLVMGQVAQAYAKAGDYESALAAMKIYRESLPEGERASADTLIKDYEKAIKEGRSKKLLLPSEQPPPPEETKAEEATTPPPEEEEGGKRKGRFYTWIAAGAAGALALSALVVGLNAQSKFDELADSCKPECPASEVDSVETRALVTDILWGTAIAAGVTAGVLYFLEGRSVKKEEPGTDVEDETFSRRLRLSPVVGAGRYGVSAGITF